MLHVHAYMGMCMHACTHTQFTTHCFNHINSITVLLYFIFVYDILNETTNVIKLSYSIYQQ